MADFDYDMLEEGEEEEEEEEIEEEDEYGEIIKVKKMVKRKRKVEVEEEEEEVAEESVLTVYDPDDFISGAQTSVETSLPVDLFDFEHSYGYNCHKYFNLCACDETVVCWATGSVVTFMDINTKQTWFRRTSTGGSVGNITSFREDPNYRIAIAEGREGNREPVIILYTWPQMEMDAVLREGTENAYSILDFSPDGELLASVGKENDYNLTIWNWKKHKILLRTSAFSFDVNTVMFSKYCEGQLTTAGAAHIKFWKMAETFTGLKLKGELGRFGKTEICDVLGVHPMPDEKVLSGCEWGNVLVWEAGLVKLEVTQKGRKNCHQAPIIQFMLSPAGDEVTTIARDGCIRAWYWDTVEQADPPEEDPYVELNPVAETCVPGCQIMCLKPQKDMYWFAQDANGGIWSVDIELDKLECNHQKIMICHAGAVVGMVVLRTHPILVTAGEDGTLLMYNTKSHQLLARYVFPAAITCVLYPPFDLDESSRIIMVGFADGVMRTLLLHPGRLLEKKRLIEVRVHSALTIHSEDSLQADILDLLSVLKPHQKPLTHISINNQRTLLVTCGEDSTLFMYKIIPSVPFKLERLGYIETPNNIAYMTWKPNEERVILLCGQLGLIMEAVLPAIEVPKYEDITTFRLEFESWKESLVKKQFMRYRPFPGEDDLASLDEEALKAAAEAADKPIDEDEEGWKGEIELMESESMLGTTITWASYCNEGEAIWVVQKQTGALLQIAPGSNKILKYAPLPEDSSWCESMTALKFICEDRYLLIGTDNGYIRVVRMHTPEEDNPDVHFIKWTIAMQKLMRELKGRRLKKEETQPVPRIDFTDFYYQPMHDFYTGAITCFEISVENILFTCGADGNVFTFNIHFPTPLEEFPELPVEGPDLSKVQREKEPSTVEGELMSHEQLKQKEEYDKMMAIANAHKKRVRHQLEEITSEYNKLIRANRLLPVSQQIDVTLDLRPLEVQERELDELKALAHRKVAHQLEASDIGLKKMYDRNIIQLDVFPFTLTAIRAPEVRIRPLRQKNLSQAFYDQLTEVHQKMAEAALRSRRAGSSTRRTASKRMSWGPPRVASFLLGLPAKPPHILKKQLRNYYQRLNRHHIQFIEWQEHLSRKPDPKALPPGAAEALKEAEQSIGNRPLKTESDYVAPHGHNTQLRLCLCRQEIYENKREFNQKVLQLRDQKVKVIELIKKIGERLTELRVELPPKLVKMPPPVPTIDMDLEFPETHLEIKIQVESTPARAATQKKTERQQERRKSNPSPLVYPQPRVRQPRVPRFVTLEESRPLTAAWEILKVKPNVESTPLEIEVRERRIERHLFEQGVLLGDAEVAVQNFDSRLRELQRERIRVQEKNQLLELHLYQLHREMDVLNRFEAHEDRLAERVYTKLMQVKSVQEQIHDCENRIEEHAAEKDTMGEACEELQLEFKRLVQDNKFADFLRRIFKKKYRPPRDHDDDDSTESESESSSSEEEDEGSYDSRDIGPIRLDPNICPEGCDPDLYHKTFEMRNNRHKHEQDMLEQDKLVDLLKKDIEAHNKVKRKLSVQLDKRKNDLREFMMEKQNCLNVIDSVVVLRYDQIRAAALRGCTGPDGLSKTVVFSEVMLQRLRQRVLELQDEIRLQKERRKINRTHLFRMNIDIRFMEQQAEEIRAEMRQVLTRKLGKPRKVDRTLDDLLRQLARRHKLSNNLRIMPHILQQFRQWRERHGELEKKYLADLDKYSKILRLAAALQADVLPKKAPKDPNQIFGAYDPEQYKRDVVRLRIVKAQQEDQIKALEDEIQKLRFKPRAETSAMPSAQQPEEKESEIWLFMIPRSPWKPRKKYFPIKPLQAPVKSYDVNIMKLLYDALDAMRVSRDDAHELLKDLTAEMPDLVSGVISRYEVVDKLVRKWLLKHGGDPNQYKKQTRAFDALAALADRLLRQHVETLEGAPVEEQRVMTSLEDALKDIAPETDLLKKRLGLALGALLLNGPIEDIDNDETMTALVSSLLDPENPLDAEVVNSIDMFDIIEEIKDCGVQMPEEDIENVVALALHCIRAQLISPDEAKRIDEEIKKTLREAEEVMHAGDTHSLKGSSHINVKASRSQTRTLKSSSQSSRR